MILGVIEFEQSIVNFFKPAFAFIDTLRLIASTVTGGDGIITVEQMLIDRTDKVTATFDRLRNSVTSTSNALNLQGNKISPLIDQTDRLGTKVLPKAKEETDDWSNSLTGLGSKAGGAAKTVETAKQKFEKYTDALKGSTSAQKAFTNAQKGSVQAQQSLNDANTALTTAQENFTQAINGYGADSQQAKDAQRELSKAQRGVENSGYRVEESVFAVRDAEKKLAEVRADPESNPQMIREAEISLAQAKLAVSDATDAQYEATTGLSKAQNLLNEAVTGAIVGSATYNIFLDAVNRAKEQQETASERLTDALDRETEAYENLAEAIAKVADAAKNSGRANLTIPTLPTVPTPGGSTGGGGSSGGGGGNTIVVNTGIGTNGVEAGRQIVQLLQQYTAVDAFAIDRLGFAPRR
jgi:chromosome segregation ATPase